MRVIAGKTSAFRNRTKRAALQRVLFEAA